MIELNTPGPNATHDEWTAWFDSFTPESHLTEDQRFLLALGQQGSATGLTGAATSFAAHIDAATDFKPATPGNSASRDMAKLSLVLAEIGIEHAAEIAQLEEDVPALQDAAREAYNAATLRFDDASNGAPAAAETPEVVDQRAVAAVAVTVKDGHSAINAALQAQADEGARQAPLFPAIAAQTLAPAPALALTAEEHAQTKSLADEMHGFIEALGGTVHAKWLALRALLHL